MSKATLDIRDHTIELGGLSFHYREAGAPDAHPVVLLHALGRDAADWDAVSAALAPEFRVLALDQRGHGSSARPGEYSFELMRDDATAFMDALGPARFSLVGHSMGGTVSYLIAEEWPARVARMVIEDTPPPRGSSIPAPPAEPPQPVSFDWRLAAPIVRQLNHPDPAWWERLDRITAPSLLIGGGSTSPIPQDQLAATAARIPDSRLVIIEGAGHDVHATRLDDFIAAAFPFLRMSLKE